MGRRVILKVSKAHAKWIAQTNLSDNERAEACAKKFGEVILAWECLRIAGGWIDTKTLAEAIGRPYAKHEHPNRRHAIRLMKKLHATGLVDAEIAPPGPRGKLTRARIAGFMRETA